MTNRGAHNSTHHQPSHRGMPGPLPVPGVRKVVLPLVKLPVGPRWHRRSALSPRLRQEKQEQEHPREQLHASHNEGGASADSSAGHGSTVLHSACPRVSDVPEGAKYQWTSPVREDVDALRLPVGLRPIRPLPSSCHLHRLMQG